MPKPPVPPEIDTFLKRPNPSVLASVEPDGRPHTAATWYLWEDGRALVNMEEGRKRLEYLRREARVSLTVLGRQDWYHQVTLLGRVAAWDEDALEDVDRLCRHYMGQPYSDREHRRVSAWIEIEAWYGWAGGRYWNG